MIILENLNLIHSILSHYRNTESCADNMDEKEVDEAIKIVEEEISNATPFGNGQESWARR